MKEPHTFEIHQQVRFNDFAAKSGIVHLGVFTVAKVADVPLTQQDPMAEDYMGGQEGQDAVGHHQSVWLEGHEDWVSGAYLEPAN